MTAPARLERPAGGAIAALCRRSVVDPPSVDELDGTLFAPDQPAVVLGDPATGVVAVVGCDDGAHIRLLAVDPSHRQRGLGHGLVQAAEDWARAEGHRSIITGADPPYFLWPGLPSAETALVCLFERRHYNRAETNFNMDVDLLDLPDDPGGHRMAGPEDADEVDAWMAAHWSNWRLEALRALHKGNLVIAREDGGTGPLSAFCAFDVNRRGLLGPVAVRPDLMGRGAGKGVLLGALHELRRRGARRVAVVWVGPVVPYAKVGGRVADVFFVYRKELA
ncbi:MAG: GNAT family N-acetyltransferase [Acidimicrobiales bacterium]|nr:GNAT family N-acetyltransferase [Acidimicrobiales bacterium]